MAEIPLELSAPLDFKLTFQEDKNKGLSHRPLIIIRQPSGYIVATITLSEVKLIQDELEKLKNLALTGL